MTTDLPAVITRHDEAGTGPIENTPEIVFSTPRKARTVVFERDMGMTSGSWIELNSKAVLNMGE